MKQLFNTVSILSICLLLIISSPIQAVRELMFTNIRQMGMGGAGVAISYDESALYKNPAGLSKANWQFKLPRLGLGLEQELYNKYQKLTDILSDQDSLSNQDLIQKVNEEGLVPLNNFGYNMYMSPILSLTTPGFGIGAFAQAHIDGGLYDKNAPYFEARANADVAPMIGFSRDISFQGQPIAIGFSGYYVERFRLYNPQDGSDTISPLLTDLVGNNSEEDSESSYELPGYVNSKGYGINLGALTPVQTPIGNGHLGVAFNNVFAPIEETITSSNSLADTETNSTSIPMTATIGLGLDTSLPKFIPFFSDLIGNFTAAIDYKFISIDNSLFKRLYMGIEKRVLWERVILRGGLNQGFFTGGIGLDLWLLRLDYASFTEELGTEIGVKPITYHVVQASILL
jgi:hypothetical protein